MLSTPCVCGGSRVFKRKEKMKDTSNILDKVKEVLEKYPETREHESELVFTYWSIEVWQNEIININWLNIYSLRKLIKDKKLTSYESICRFARMIKSKYPELKGKRKRKSEEEVKEELLVYKKDLFEL